MNAVKHHGMKHVCAWNRQCGAGAKTTYAHLQIILWFVDVHTSHAHPSAHYVPVLDLQILGVFDGVPAACVYHSHFLHDHAHFGL
jgi:hypothetical protein